jgi:hypothetical protein
LATVDYVPLERWVLVTVTVKEKFLSVFLDDAVVSSTMAEDTRGAREQKRVPVLNKTIGSVYVGGGAATADAYISKLVYYNYALTLRQIQRVYAWGPGSASFLTRLGLPAYGVRSPVYKLDATTV